MVKELAHHGYHIGPGSLHRATHKMKAEGLIRSHSEVAVGQVMPLIENPQCCSSKVPTLVVLQVSACCWL